MPSSSAVIAALLTGACTTTGIGTGIGTGSSRIPEITATFTWSAQGPRTGTMMATLADGRQYSGTFFQITSETRVEELGPLWAGWPAMYGRRFYCGSWLLGSERSVHHPLFGQGAGESRWSGWTDALPLHADAPLLRHGGRRPGSVRASRRRSHTGQLPAALNGGDVRPFLTNF